MPVQKRLPKLKSDESTLEKLGHKYLNSLLKLASKQPGLKKSFPANRGSKKTIVELSLVSKADIKKLNQSWRGKNQETDILSFPMPKLFLTKIFVRDLNEIHLGELVICLPVMKAQARALGHTAERELQVLLTHGFLHLLGFDHELGEKEARLMKNWEDLLLGADRSSGLISRSGKLKTKK
jgi:probable rRNA maturation factor